MKKKFFNSQLKFAFLLGYICLPIFSSAQNFYLFIGTYTGSGSKGIYVYNFNASNGQASLVSNTDSATNPSYLTVARNGKYVYAVNETNGSNPGRVSAYSFDKKEGSLHFLNTQFSGGDDPCYVAASADNHWLTVANYSSGSAAIFPLNKDGSLQPYSQLMQTYGSSINKERQERSHIHETVFSPDNAYLFTPDLGTDKIMIYRFQSKNKKPLSPSNPPYVTTGPGSGPRHITFHPNKKFAYLISELAGTVTTYRYGNGKLLELQKISTHPEGFKGAIGAAEVEISPDGNFLYASNRGDQNSLTIFYINPITGKLKLIGYQSTLGKAPRHFMIDPTGNFLLVANQDSDNIVIFKRNKKTGMLNETGEQIHLPKPVCLQMIAVK
jgi:6-phosphogluconolactonase